MLEELFLLCLYIHKHLELGVKSADFQSQSNRSRNIGTLPIFCKRLVKGSSALAAAVVAAADTPPLAAAVLGFNTSSKISGECEEREKRGESFLLVLIKTHEREV